MPEPQLSPDGNWMWNGTQWVPNPNIVHRSSSNNQKVTLNDSVISGDVINTVNNSPEAIASGVLAALKEIGIVRGLPASDEQLEKIHEIEELIESNENLSPDVYYSMADKELKLAMNYIEDFQKMRNVLSKAKKYYNQSLKSSLINGDKFWEALASSSIDYVEFLEVCFSGTNYLDVDKDKVFLFGERVIEKISEKSKILESANDIKKLVEIHKMKGDAYQVFGNLLRWSDYDNAKTFFDLAINENQKVVNYSNSTNQWEDVANSYSELLDLFTITKNYNMAEMSFKEASTIIEKHNLDDINKFHLYINHLSFVKATKVGMELKNESKLIKDLIYSTGFNSGIQVSVIDKLIEINDDSDMNLPPPPGPGLLNNVNSGISTNEQNHGLGSIKVIREGSTVQIRWNTALPDDIQKALSVMSDADPLAKLDDLSKYVYIGQFDEQTQVKLWSIWRERQNLFTNILSDHEASEHSLEMMFFGFFFLIVGAIDIIGSYNDFDLWGDFLGFDLPLWLWMITGYIEISLGFICFSAASGE